MILPPPILAEPTIVVPNMEGVTTALVAFIFVCVIYPRLVKNKTQFYAALTAVIIIILLHSLSAMLRDSAGFQVFSGAMVGLLQAGAILLLFLSAGGITLKELGSDMARAYEVIRRGEDEKEVIIPIGGTGGEQPRPRSQSPTSQPAETIPPARTPETAPPAEKIDLPPQAGWPTKAPPDKKPDSSSLPLE